ncbi:hypothetical protein J437_LFUL009200 [Ladona fulva]|uniref:Uncharacterized protein n=1 Tax=Ladona fulva TaxID=123851 RepID=A0A8K0K9D5_LADFU|nr:hypothetical protein J437_LFUL009200 [Ladona fulva]
MSFYQKNDPELRKQAKKPPETISANINLSDEESDREICGRVAASGAQLKKQRATRNGRKQSLRAAASYLQEYCGSTSLHGLRYMGEERRPLVERICWLVAFGLSIMACGHLIHKVWKKWENTPVIVSFADSSTPVWQIPFPAVTICSETKYRKSVFNYTDINYKLANKIDISEENMRRYEYKSLLCEGNEYLNNATWNTTTEAIKFLQQNSIPNY